MLLNSLIIFLQQLPPLGLALLSLPLYFGFMLLAFRWFGKAGLMAYVCLAIIGANLQVLKVSYFGFLGGPVALGTSLFASGYLATDLLTEYYGAKAARKAVFLGLFAMLFWTLLTTLMLSFAPLTPQQAGSEYAWALETQGHLEALFKWTPNLLVASLSAYLLSQLSDVYVFSWLKKKTKGRFLWLRNNVSTMLSSLLDNAVFSFTAFYFLTDAPVPLKSLIFSYVLGTYLIRVMVSLFDTPFMYLARVFLPKELKA